MSKNVSEVLRSSMEKVREMVDANTVIGTPITVNADTTVIPVSKVFFGIGSGGADSAPKENQTIGGFAGGAGCGVKITPVAFLVVQGERVRILNVDEPAGSAAERLVEQLPMLVDKISELLPKRNTETIEI